MQRTPVWLISNHIDPNEYILRRAEEIITTNKCRGTQLLNEVDILRRAIPQTEDLYRELCVLLFYRYGIRPTTSKLIQLVGEGSMNVAADAIRQFWEDVLERMSRVPGKLPDVPETLKAKSPGVVASLDQARQESSATSHSESKTNW